MFDSGTGGDQYTVFSALGRRLGANLGYLTERYGARCRAAIEPLLSLEPLVQVMGSLRRDGYLLFLNSATPRRELTVLVTGSPIAEAMTEIHGGPATKAANLTSIMFRHGVCDDEIVVVGDGEDDRDAARTAGCQFVGPDHSVGGVICTLAPALAFGFPEVDMVRVGEGENAIVEFSG